MSNHEVTYYQSGPDGEHLAVDADIVATHQEYQSALYQYVQKYAGEALPAAIPVDDIHKYYQDMGRRVAPVVAIDSDDPLSLEVLQEVGLSETAKALQGAGVQGAYVPEGDIVLVAINRGNQNDPQRVNTTRTLAHEQGHAGQKTTYSVIQTNDKPIISPVAGGFLHQAVGADGKTRIVGLPLTEAQAELHATQFAERQGLTQVADPQLIDGLYLPASYCKRMQNGVITYSFAASAAIAVELLAAKDPTLLDLVLDGAKSQATESILFERLRALNEEYPGVAKALLLTTTDEALEGVGKKVSALLGSTKQDIVDAHDNATELVNHRIKAQQENSEWSQPAPVRDRVVVLGTSPAPNVVTSQTAREGLEDNLDEVRDKISQAIGRLATGSPSTLSSLAEAHDRLGEALELLYSQLGQPGSKSFNRYAHDLAPLLTAQELFESLKGQVIDAALAAQTVAERLR
jgi:hypothetical protein